MIILTGISGGISNKIITGLLKIDNIIGIYNSNKPRGFSKNKKLQLIKLDFLKENEVNKFLSKFLLNDKKITIIHLASLKNDELLVNLNIKKLKRNFQVNFFIPFILTKFFLPMMIQNKWGRVIFFSSTGGERGDTGTASYTSSKHAIKGLSKVISKEYGKFNITSNLIKLGNFKTGMFNELSEKKKKNIMDSIPSNKLGNFIDIVSAIKLIIKSGYINGTEINIDGGM